MEKDDANERRAPGAAMEELLAVMARLRGPGGCPWDAEQTLETLKTHLVEECYEVLDAMDAGDPAAHLEELGDLLLQIVFQACIREEQGAFGFRDVADAIRDKLIRRHPHVFGDAVAATPEAVLRRWEAIKAAEKGGAAAPRSVLAGVPRSLPALRRAQQVQTRAARVGFDWSAAADVAAKVEEEWAEVREALAGGEPDRIAEEIGDLLFAVVNLSRFHKLQAEQVLDGAIEKFSGRFRAMEARMRERGQKPELLSLEELDGLWEEAKRAERAARA